MAEATFPERRTRSQIALPDNILAIPSGSPLKAARNALRKHNETVSSTADSDEDEEERISPGKSEPHKKTGNTKRSASPTLRDEYRVSSPNGRELKRTRYNGVAEQSEHNVGTSQYPTGHSRTNSDTKLVLAGRSKVKKSTSRQRKPTTATASESPPPTIFSPASTSPKGGRAQSVPIFFNSEAIPRIDLRNPPQSPKRSRSRSRSPSKERPPKLRVIPSTFSLPTIQDDVVMNEIESHTSLVDRPSASSLSNTENMDTVRPEKHSEILEATATSPGRERIQSSTSPKEVIPASPSSKEIAIPLPAGLLKTSLSPPPEIVPASPPASYKPMNPPVISTVMATPATHSLNQLMPMSPLTPLPETPFPLRQMPSAAMEDRLTDDAGWTIAPMKSLTNFHEPAKTSVPPVPQSRLPRPSVASKTSKPLRTRTTMGPPSLPSSSKTIHGPDSTPSIPNHKPVPATATGNIFSYMMKNSAQLSKVDGEKLKTTDKGKKSMPPPSFFSSTSKIKSVLAEKSPLKPQQKLKQKMRLREKQEVKPTLMVLHSDEEESESNEDRSSECQTEVAGLSSMSKDVADAVNSEDPIPHPSTEELKVPTMDVGNDEIGSNHSANLSQHEAIETVTGEIIHEPDNMEDPQESSEVATSSAMEISIEVHAVSAHTSEGQDAAPSTSTTDVVASTETQSAQSQSVDPPTIPQEATQEPPSSRVGKNKASLGKKRQPAIPLPSRVTRSTSRRKPENEADSVPGTSAGREMPPRANTTPKKQTKLGASKNAAPASKTEARASGLSIEVDMLEDSAGNLPPGSPMRISPAKSPKAPAKAQLNRSISEDMLLVHSTPAKSSHLPPSPSPTKIARSTLLAMRPTAASIARTFSSSSLHSAPNSSLSTLSNALEKLRMPAPSRPSTSMGFNRDSTGDDDDAPARSKDDVAIGRTSTGPSHQAGRAIQRSVTLEHSSVKPLSNSAGSSRASLTSGTKPVQKPLTSFMAGKGNAASRRVGPFGNKSSIFSIGGGPRRTVSKKSTLPVVIGSPVKSGASAGEDKDEPSGNGGEANEKNDEATDDGGKLFNAIVNGGSATELMANLLAQGPDKGKEKEVFQRPAHSSRRVSMLSRDLSHSLNAMPPPPLPAVAAARGDMGPPSTPPRAVRADLNPGSGGSGSSIGTSPSQAGPSKRSSARLANVAASTKANAPVEPISAGKKSAANPANPAAMILKDCVVFVDVKSEDGDEAGSLFVEMLEGVGARVLTRVGQSCTHIVFKNGLPSTITRYKLLRDPKPLVVGIAWVVECIERRARIDETNFLINLDRVNIAGHHKRRRSILPRLFTDEGPSQDDAGEGDQSMDGSVSSITLEEDLTPLEKARRRKNKMAGQS